MHYCMRLGVAFLGPHAPLCRCRLDQHQPRRASGHAQRLKEAPHRMRPVGVLVAVLWISGGLNQFYPLPIRVQLIRDDSRQRGSAAAAHLRPVRDDVGRSARVDRQINAGVQSRFL